MKKFTQTVLVALSLLAAVTAIQASAQTSKAPVKTRPAVVRERPGTETKDDRRMIKARTFKARTSRARAYVGVVNVNSASSAQLRRLPNVGPQTAASIIRNRPYRNVAQFRSANKRFISPLEWRKMSRRVRL